MLYAAPEKGQDAALDSETLGRARYARQLAGDTQLSKALSFLKRHYRPPSWMRHAWERFTERVTRASDFIARLSSLSNIAKQAGTRFDPEWMNSVNLGLSIGYLTDNSQSEALVAVKAWVSDDGWRPGGEACSEAEFNKLFEDSAREFLSCVEANCATDWPTLDEYIADPQRWATSGSSRIRAVIEARIEDAVVRAQNSKWSTAAMTWPETLTVAIRSPVTDQILTVVVKREAGKIRYVIAGDDTTYLRMAYVAGAFEHRLKRSAHTPLFWSTGDKLAWARNRVLLIRQRSTWFAPVDQTKYDHHFTRAMILILAKVLCEAATRAVADGRARDDVHLCCERITATLAGEAHIPMDVHGVTHRVRYERGLLSGWRWTTLMNTVGNYAICNVARIVQRLDRPSDLVVMGDDAASAWPSLRNAFLFCEGFRRLNFDVNPAKTFLSQDRDEFLRFVYTKDGVYGYPYRLAPSLMYRKPWSNTVPSALDRLREILSTWGQFASRLDVTGTLVRNQTRAGVLSHSEHVPPLLQTAINGMVKDLTGASGLSRDVVLSWLRTPVAVGGGGWCIGATPYTRISSVLRNASYGIADATTRANVPGMAKQIRVRSVLEWHAETVTWWQDNLVALRGANIVAATVGINARELAVSGVTWRPSPVTIRLGAYRPRLIWRDVPLTGREVALSVATSAQLRSIAHVLWTRPDDAKTALAELGKALFVTWVSGNAAVQWSMPTTNPITVASLNDAVTAAVLARRATNDVLASAAVSTQHLAEAEVQRLDFTWTL